MSSIAQNSSHPSLSHADSVATSTSDLILLVGRILLGSDLKQRLRKDFRYSGLRCRVLQGRGLPTFLAYIAVPAEFFGGIAIIFTGLATRYVVLVMIIFMLVATFSSHRYWEFTDVAVRRAQLELL